MGGEGGSDQRRKREEASKGEFCVARSGRSSDKSVQSSGREPLYRPGLDGHYGEDLKGGDASVDCTVPCDSVIWVNIFDPINGPSFKPSPLKPIPLFMQRPHIPIVEPQRQPSAVDLYLQSPLPLSPSKNSISAPSTLCPTRSPTPVGLLSRVSSPYRPLSAQLRIPSPDFAGDVGPQDVRRQYASAVVKEEPLKRPSSRIGANHRRSGTRSSVYHTAQEYMDANLKAPSPKPPDDITVETPKLSLPVLTAPAHSSEYLERYQPTSTLATRRLESLMEQSRRGLELERGQDFRREFVSSTIGMDDDDGQHGVRGELRKFFTGK